jgi:type II secretory pathway pseudopilin PulG
MSQKAIKTVAIVLLVVALTAAAATISFYVQQRRVDAAEAQIQTAAAQKSELLDKIATLESQAALNAARDAANAPAQAETATATTPDATPQKAPVKTITKYGYFTSGKMSNGIVTFKVDYADFLTGDKAAAAATAAGEESPPPNDYYISNTSSKLRTFKVAKSAKFKVAGTTPDETVTLSRGEFLDAIINNTDGATDAGYWIKIKGDTITSAEEQWTP